MMGICKSKEKPEVHLLTERQRYNLMHMVSSGPDGNAEHITAATLRALWHGTLTQYLINLFIDHMFKTSDEIQFDDFERFYYHMVESPGENRARIIMSMIGTEDGLSPRSLHKYIVNVVESYVNILKVTNPEAFYTWGTGDEVYTGDLHRVAEFCMKRITLSENMKLSLRDLERWLFISTFIRDVFESVIHHSCNMEVGELRPILPKADKYTTLLRIPTVLMLSHMTRAYTKRLWRLLYDSWTDAHSWSFLERRILDQGPTIVLIEEVGGVLFGGFASMSWKVRNGFYGDDNCFLFRLRPDIVKCVASGQNRHFQYLFDGKGMNPRGLAFGGFLNYFGIFLDPEFGPGKTSDTCGTFSDYTRLSNNKDFYFSRIEVWGIADPDEKGNALWLEQRRKRVDPALLAATRLLADTDNDFIRAFRSPDDSDSDVDAQ